MEGQPPPYFPSAAFFLFAQKLQVNPDRKNQFLYVKKLKWYIFFDDLLAVFRVLTQEMYEKKAEEADPLILRTMHTRPFRSQKSSTTVHTKGGFSYVKRGFYPPILTFRDPSGPKIRIFSFLTNFHFFNQKKPQNFDFFDIFSKKPQNFDYFTTKYNFFSF